MTVTVTAMWFALAGIVALLFHPFIALLFAPLHALFVLGILGPLSREWDPQRRARWRLSQRSSVAPLLLLVVAVLAGQDRSLAEPVRFGIMLGGMGFVLLGRVAAGVATGEIDVRGWRFRRMESPWAFWSGVALVEMLGVGGFTAYILAFSVV